MLKTSTESLGPAPQLILYGKFLRRHWVLYSMGLVFMILTSAMSIGMPAVISWAIDLLSKRSLTAVPQLFRADDLPRTLGALVVTAVIIQFVAFIARIGWRQSLARATHMAGAALKISLWNAIKDKDFAEFLPLRFGDVMNRATADWNYSRIIFGFVWVVTLDIILMIGFGAAAMARIDWVLAVMALGTLPFAAWISRKYAKREFKEHTRSQETLGKLSELTAHMIYSVRLQRSTHTESRWLENLDELAVHYARERLDTLRTGLRIYPVASFPSLFAYFILLTAGIYRLQEGVITLGQFIALQSYVVVIQGVLFEISQNITEWQRGFASLKRLTEFIGVEWTDQASKERKSREEGIDVTRLQAIDVSVAYPNAPNSISGISFCVQKGEWLGVQGAIGAGKSTLMSALAGLLPCSDGQIELDQRMLRNTAEMRPFTTLISQTSHFFSGSIRMNLCLDKSFDDAELWKVLHIVAMDIDVGGMVKGLDTEINEGGANLSGGQKQRLSLARALLRESAIILCDDILSAVDVTTEQTILRELRTRWANRIVIYASHKAHLRTVTDQLLVLPSHARGSPL